MQTVAQRLPVYREGQDNALGRVGQRRDECPQVGNKLLERGGYQVHLKREFTRLKAGRGVDVYATTVLKTRLVTDALLGGGRGHQGGQRPVTQRHAILGLEVVRPVPVKYRAGFSRHIVTVF